MAFYQYRQNNTGGNFDVKEGNGISVIVIVEATSAAAADHTAEFIGLYFDGSSDGSDCPCCGDRWYRAYGGDEVPSYYGAPIDFTKESQGSDFDWILSDLKSSPIGYVHYLDGRVVGFY